MLDLKRDVKILVVYIAVTQGPLTSDYASRFVGSYLACPPGVRHDTIVACNGGPLPRALALMFDPLGAAMMPRINDPGWDISAYQDIANQIECDLLVCLGESVYFHREGWLKRIADAWKGHGPGLYGFFSSNLVRPHLNTTAFVCDPALLRQYPKPTSRAARYDFEHGEHSFWRFVQSLGKPTCLVTFDGVWAPLVWRLPNDILWRGTQTNCLAFCSHTDHYFAADAATKKRWSAWIDAPFK